MEHAWARWRNTVTDPEHMTAVELVHEILSSDNEDRKTWAFSFATQQGDKPYTVADLLEKVVNQDKLLNAGGTKKNATALFADHGITRPTFKPKINKKGKQKKRCATKDCKNIVRAGICCTSTSVQRLLKRVPINNTLSTRMKRIGKLSGSLLLQPVFSRLKGLRQDLLRTYDGTVRLRTARGKRGPRALLDALREGSAVVVEIAQGDAWPGGGV